MEELEAQAREWLRQRKELLDKRESLRRVGAHMCVDLPDSRVRISSLPEPLRTEVQRLLMNT